MIKLGTPYNRILRTIIASLPVHYQRDQHWQIKGYSTAAHRYTIQTPNQLTVNVNDVGYLLAAQADLDLSVEATWDSISTDYRVAATRAGKDFFIYACQPSSGIAPVILISANSTYPTGYDADTSRKIGGFHCLCTAVGTISGHTLTGFAQGDILPQSVWDLNFRPACDDPRGMVYSPLANIWVDIYLQSGTGASTLSANGGTITDTRTWMDHVDDLAAVGKKLLDDGEFQIIAEGSNQETNISGSADPVTTGGHSDTAGRRMISNIGCEDCCGAMWQWLRDQSYRFDGAANHTHSVTVSGDPQTVNTGNPSADVSPAYGWYDLGSKGSLYKQGTYGDVKLVAGGSWNSGSYCGSRCRSALASRWDPSTSICRRGRAEHRRLT